MPTELQVLNIVTQGGSFVVLCVILWYVGMRLIPREQQARDDLANKFDAALARRDGAQNQIASALTQVVTGLNDVTDRLERVERVTGEHRQL